MELQEATTPGAELTPSVHTADGRVRATIHARIGDYKVRAVIYCDASPYGSKEGNVSVWDKTGMTWNRIYGLYGGLSVSVDPSKPLFADPQNIDPAVFAADMAELIGAARDILL